jgi:hypothetical protein
MPVVPNSSTLNNDRENGGPELEQFIPENRVYTEGPNAKRAQYLLAIFGNFFNLSKVKYVPIVS